MDRGTVRAARITEQLADAIAKAVDGKDTGPAIRAAIERAGRRFTTAKLARVLEEEILHGQMLGALDADWEAENRTAIAPVRFKERDTRFAQRPLVEAIRVFNEREPVTREVFDAMEEGAQRRAFTIARAANRKMVATAKRALAGQLARGADLADFREVLRQRLEAAGWTPANPSHVETVFRTNVMSAYGGGRARQMMQPEVLAARPYWQILGVTDSRQRPTHRAVHQVVLRADDEFWLTAYPPFGYNCRCRVRSLGEAEGAKLVRSGSSIRDLPDPGFTSGLGVALQD